jgi:glucose dehydrogenase
MSDSTYDVVIVGAGIAGSIVALELARAGKRVLVLEAGQQTPPTNRETYLETFFLNPNKTPESPYPPLAEKPGEQATPRATIADTFTDNIESTYQGGVQSGGALIYDPQKSYLLQQGPNAFASTYERIAGGTTWHWLGTSLRFLANDFQMRSLYHRERDWPFGVDELLSYYNAAEATIGVAADARVQEAQLGSVGLEYSPSDYQYPMGQIPPSLVDQNLASQVDGLTDLIDFEGLTVQVTPTPAGRNSQATSGSSRRTCAGNTNCIPICPIQAKYDATVTLSAARQTGLVDVLAQTVATRVVVGENGSITGIEYVQWTESGGQVETTGTGTAVGTVYVLAAHAIETPRLLLMSRQDGRGELVRGVANGSDQVGRNLMDHPLYLSWSLNPQPIYGFRGPLATSGIETLRDGAFRSERAAWRVEIGNEGWNFSIGDPWTSVLDWVDGSNVSQLNPSGEELFGDSLVATLNHIFTRQWRMGFLVEQTPDPGNRVRLASDVAGLEQYTDGLGLPRPVINYALSEYTQLGFVYAEIFARQIYQRLGATCYTQNPRELTRSDGTRVANPDWFPMQDGWLQYFEGLPPELKDPAVTCKNVDANGVPDGFQYFGSGHIVGTTIMGSASGDSVVDPDSRSWDHDNLFIVGSSTFPTITTANPTLTIAALALRTAGKILADLGG